MKLTMTAREAAEAIGLHPSRFYALVAAGRIPGVVRIGRAIRIHRAALEEWLRAGGDPGAQLPRKPRAQAGGQRAASR